MMIRRWTFYAQTLDEEGSFYLNEDDIFMGTDQEADLEARRRADSWEEENGGWISRIIYESQGIITN